MPILTKGLNKKLRDLIQLDIDASYCYERAADKIVETDVRQQLEVYRGDHERHVDILARELERMGEQAPEHKTDLKGMFLKGATVMQSVAGTIGALKAMQLNEKLTNRIYARAARWKGVPEDIVLIINGNFDDEKRHLQYLDAKLDELTIG